jgi:predicted DNA-binding transcriptional regulator AlpA
MSTERPYELLTVDRAAEEIGIGRTKMFLLLRDGDGPPIIKIGALTRIRRGALNAWLLEREKSAA